MVKGFSKVILVGNMTRDIEMRTTPSGTNVGSFSLAVNRNFKSANGETTEQTSFIDCTAWGRLAEIIQQYTHKGAPLMVSGRLEQHSWDDKSTGQKRSRVEVILDDMVLLGGGNSQGGNYGGGYEAGSGGFGGSFGGGTSESAGKSGSKNSKSGEGEIVPDDIPDGQIDMSDIPF